MNKRSFFLQFSGESPHIVKCDNCGAKLLADSAGRDPRGRTICCAHCLFNPQGCRCKYGQYGVEETYSDPDYPEFGPYDEDEENGW